MKRFQILPVLMMFFISSCTSIVPFSSDSPKKGELIFLNHKLEPSPYEGEVIFRYNIRLSAGSQYLHVRPGILDANEGEIYFLRFQEEDEEGIASYAVAHSDSVNSSEDNLYEHKNSLPPAENFIDIENVFSLLKNNVWVISFYLDGQEVETLLVDLRSNPASQEEDN